MNERMEPERNIEKLLRAYAKKRRAEAGEPLKLHPSVRRRLQGELARNAPKSADQDSVPLWDFFRQQWAFLLGFAFIIFFVATMFLPAFAKAKNKSQRAMAMNNLRQIGIAAQMAAEENGGILPAKLDVLTNGLVPETVLTDPQSGERFVYLAGGKNLGDLQSNAVIAFSPADKRGRAVLLASGSVQIWSSERSAALTNQKNLQLAMTVAPARPEMKPASAPVVIADADRDAGTLDGNFKLDGANRLASADRRAAGDDYQAQQQLSAGSASMVANGLIQTNLAEGQRYFQNTSTSAPDAGVLARFQLWQSAGRFWVVDQDGSIYEGSLQTADQSARTNFFRVTGTNQSRKQIVVFTGSLVVNSPLSPGGNSGESSQSGLANESTLVIGTALIGGSNRVEINASSLSSPEKPAIQTGDQPNK